MYKGNREYVYKFEPTSYSSTNVYEGQHYNRFGGAFGFSDEDIDTIFEGDPSAYWNIDWFLKKKGRFVVKVWLLFFTDSSMNRICAIILGGLALPLFAPFNVCKRPKALFGWH